jgi:hypothetical protein
MSETSNVLAASDRYHRVAYCIARMVLVWRFYTDSEFLKEHCIPYAFKGAASARLLLHIGPTSNPLRNKKMIYKGAFSSTLL